MPQGGKKKAKKQQQRVNTSVYVTGLPEVSSDCCVVIAV